jgi:glycine betaine/proline transport system ATP-binding protein
MTINREKTKSLDETPVIECRNLWKVYARNQVDIDYVVSQKLDKDSALEGHKAVVAVGDASFQVSRGETFCIMGLSGSGKSTLVRHINRLIEPSAGKIFVNGIDVGDLPPKDLRELRSTSIGMVFQNMALFPNRLVRDNITFGLEMRNESLDRRREVAGDMLSLVQLEGWGDRYPSELSGGMQQRVGLARALAADPDILLMDEPFSALDPLIRRQLQDQFLEISSKLNKTSLFITHDLDEAIRMGDRIAIMKDGELVQIGQPSEIILNPVDDYVKAFVGGVSRLKLLSAVTVMKPIESNLQNVTSFDDYPRVDADCSLDKLMEVIISNDQPVAVTNESGKLIGTITARNLLEAIVDTKH